MLKALKSRILSIDIFNSLYSEYKWKKVLRNYHQVSDEEFVTQSFLKETGVELDLKNPKRFGEKLCWLKIHNNDPLLTTCADKVAVRSYVEESGLGDILTPLKGVYGSTEEINFSDFSDPVFIKCNHVSGGNIIFDKTKPFDYKRFKQRFDFLLKTNLYYSTRELHYKEIQPKIIVEEVLRDQNNQLPIDYKFFCFNGEAKFAFVNVGVAKETGQHATDDEWQNFDLGFNPLDFSIRKPSEIKRKLTKPENWERMIEIANILSKPFKHARIDLYNIDGRIYFGEITFYHCAGYFLIEPIEKDLEIGSWIDLSE